MKKLCGKERENRDLEILKYLDNGMSQGEIGEKLGITQSAVSKIINRLSNDFSKDEFIKYGLLSNKELEGEILRLLMKGYEVEDIATIMNISVGKTNSLIGGLRTKYRGTETMKYLLTSNEKEINSRRVEILKYLRQGLSQVEIEAKINVGQPIISRDIQAIKSGLSKDELNDLNIISREAKIESRREEVLELLPKGLTQRKMGDILGVSSTTIFRDVKFLKSNMGDDIQDLELHSLDKRRMDNMSKILSKTIEGLSAKEISKSLEISLSYTYRLINRLKQDLGEEAFNELTKKA